MFKSCKKLFDILGQILAVALVVVFALMILNAKFDFLPEQVLNIFKVVKEYGFLALAGIVGLEAMSQRNFLFQIIFLALIALIVVFMFFPETYQNLIGLVTK